eukprot:3207930-Ditylum_brightwellii.AAC.1
MTTCLNLLIGPMLQVLNASLHQVEQHQQHIGESDEECLVLPLLQPMETIKLSELLMKQSMINLSSSSSSPPLSSSNLKNSVNDRKKDNQRQEEQQEVGVELRILMGYLLRHLHHLIHSSSLSSTSPSNEHNGTMGGDIITTTRSLSFSTWAYTNNEANSNHILLPEDMEDFMDLCIEYQVEIVEHSLDVLEYASHVLQSFVDESDNAEGNVDEESVVIIHDNDDSEDDDEG